MLAFHEVVIMSSYNHEQSVRQFLESVGEEYNPQEAEDSVSYGERQGYEVAQLEAVQGELLDTIMDEIAQEEAEDSDIWDFESDGSVSVFEAGGMFNVAPLAHWTKPRIKSEIQTTVTTVELESRPLAYRDKAGPKSKMQYALQAYYVGDMVTVSGGELSGSRFNPEKYHNHDKSAKKARARFCIEWLYNSQGKVVKPETARARQTPEGKKEAKAAKIAAKLARMDRQLAMMAANKAKWA